MVMLLEAEPISLRMTPQVCLRRLHETAGRLESAKHGGWWIRRHEHQPPLWFPDWAVQDLIDAGLVGDDGKINARGQLAVRQCRW
jgi:hypothetical protein